MDRRRPDRVAHDRRGGRHAVERAQLDRRPRWSSRRRTAQRRGPRNIGLDRGGGDRAWSWGRGSRLWSALRRAGHRSRPDDGAWRRLGRLRSGRGLRRRRGSRRRSPRRLGFGDQRGLDRRRGRCRLGVHRSGHRLDGRRRCRSGDGGVGCGNRRRLGRRSGDAADREQPLRVDVAVRLGGQPDAEVDVRCRGDAVFALADLADDRPLRDGAASGDDDRSELEERDGMAVGGLDRHGPAAARDGAGEGDGTGSGCADGVADGAGDVDAAVLARGVRVRANREGPEHRTVGGPDPAGGSGSDCQARDRDDRDGEGSPHRTPPSWEEGNCVPR